MSERLNAIADILAKFREASEAERLAVAAVAAIGDADVAAIRSWAAGGLWGPRRARHVTARTEANDRLVEAMVHAQAVQVASGDLEAERSEITAGLKEVAERLEAVALDALSERFADELGGLVKFAEEVQTDRRRFTAHRVPARGRANVIRWQGRTTTPRLDFQAAGTARELRATRVCADVAGGGRGGAGVARQSTRGFQCLIPLSVANLLREMRADMAPIAACVAETEKQLRDAAWPREDLGEGFAEIGEGRSYRAQTTEIVSRRGASFARQNRRRSLCDRNGIAGRPRGRVRSAIPRS